MIKAEDIAAFKASQHSAAPKEEQAYPDVPAPLDARVVSNIVTAVWDELAGRGLDIQELVDNSNTDLLNDIFEGMSQAVQRGASQVGLQARPFDDEQEGEA
ncbi:hypothetical protein [Deinococcus multiflagellatus]|uniref:Uncharacterized protein n=1 Tax=Deinococcus multiflagellatus TaxID=1656887 RepID=A0ABW1ZQY0_9DEIO|nr:hypothetical protein [Deinococcus multiflagellatus]MBZ9715364.1 hypothetical protein [Deinococcus multiflagellatus]